MLRRETAVKILLPLAHVCKIDILKDFAKFLRKQLYQILYLMKLQGFIAIENLAQMFSCEFCEITRIPFPENSSGRLLLAFQVHKVDKNLPRYFNKDIKVISIEAIWTTLCQLQKWFCMVRKPWNTLPKKTYQNLRNLRRTYLWGSFVIVKPFFAVRCTHSESGKTTAVEMFCENSQRVKAAGYFHRRAPPWNFDRILNATRPNNLF